MPQRNSEKRRQLKTVPCGRSLVIEVLGEEAKPMQTMKIRFSMKDLMKDTSLGGSPRFASLSKRIWGSTLSYAPSKCRNAAVRTLFFYRDSFIAFVSNMKASVDEWCFLKPV